VYGKAKFGMQGFEGGEAALHKSEFRREAEPLVYPPPASSLAELGAEFVLDPVGLKRYATF
jgi:hypothetical protein